MDFDVREGVLTIDGDDGRRIGVGTGGPTMRIDIGEAGASIADAVGIGMHTPCCRFEVRSDGAMGVGEK